VDAPEHGWTDKQLDQVVGNLLRAGVITAAAVVGAGAVLYLLQFGQVAPEFMRFQGVPPALENVADIVTAALRLEGKAVIQLGLLLLLATPIARVIILLFAFAAQRDRTYVAITAVVLIVLLMSLAGMQFGG